MDNLILDKTTVENSCIGRYFKAEANFYKSKRGFGYNIRFNELKRKSCKGCQHCGWMDEVIQYIAEENNSIDWDKIETGKIYTITVCNISRDWETGIVDDWDYKLVEVELE